MLENIPKGDFHNFNRFVSQRKLNGAIVFNKPRPVFWEMFFFGERSPLKRVFTSTTIQMNLRHLQAKGVFDNDVKAINSADRLATLDDFYAFGQLLAYCYFFGLQDIHKDNLLITENGLQVIDLEQAFSDMLLPNQSLLLPVNPGGIWIAGLNVLTNKAIDQLGKFESKKMIDGFLSLSKVVLDSVDQITEILLTSQASFQNQPLRVYLRGTKDYDEKLRGESAVSNWFYEESVQLTRGDIPYFFSYLGDNNVYYYTTKCGVKEKAEVPAAFHKFTDYCGKNIADLFNKKLIREKWARGILFLAKKLEILDGVDLQWTDCSVVRKEGQLKFISPLLMVTTKAIQKGN